MLIDDEIITYSQFVEYVAQYILFRIFLIAGIHHDQRFFPLSHR